MAFVNTLPLAVKAGWVVWIAWAAAQVMWYRRARVAAPVVPAPKAAPVARRRPEPRPDPRPEPRPEPRAVRQEAAPASAQEEPTSSLPTIDLSDILAAADRSSAREQSTPHHPGSILGLDPRPSSN
jgi:hypothetical protein